MISHSRGNSLAHRGSFLLNLSAGVTQRVNWKKTIYHDGTPFFRQPRTAGTGEDLTLTLRICKKSPVQQVFLRTNPDGEEEMSAMEIASSDDFFIYYKALIALPRAGINYRFFLITGENGYWFNRKGISNTMPRDRHDFKMDIPESLPEWVPETVFYQIFPDRFCNGNPEINIKNDEYEYRGKKTAILNWDDPEPSPESNGHFYFYGGDLAGIEQKLNYLEELGVNGLYLTPIFHAPSNHKYDTQDYHTVDPHFGTNEDFARLTGKLHSRGMRIILDGVFNHVGVAHKWFNRSGFYSGGAWNDPESPYRDFFFFNRYPEDYRCWKGVESLPKLNFHSEGLRDAIYRTPESAGQSWLREPYSIDGWRFDVANMMGRSGESQIQHEVWSEMRACLKKAAPDSYLLGEHFFDGGDLMDTSHLDGLMNYQGFTFPVWKWLTGKDGFLSGWERITYPCDFKADDMATQMREFRASLTHGQELRMFNLLNSHDTPRLISLVDNNPDLYLCGMVLLFTYPGIPSIFYGDEAGLDGSGDPDCRRPMLWDPEKRDEERFDLYKKLIRLRRESPCLARGGFMELSAEADHMAYARIYGKENLISVVRKADQPGKICLPLYCLGKTEGTVRNILSGEEHSFSRGCLKLDCAPVSAMILEIV